MAPTQHRPRSASSGAHRAGAVLVAAVAFGGLASSASAQTDGSWPAVGRDAQHTGTADGPSPPFREAWSSEIPANPIAGPVVSGDALVVVGTASVVALEASTGDVLWERERLPGSSGPALIVGDAVVHASGKGRAASLIARALDTGLEDWRAPIGAAVVGGPAAADDLVVAGTRAGTVVAVESATGEQAWEFETEGRIDSSPAVWEDTVLVVADDLEAGTSTVLALDAGSGEESWRFAPEGLSVGSSSVSVAEGLAYVGMGDGRIHAFEVETGVERWSVPAYAGRQAFRARQVPSSSVTLLVPDLIVLHALDPGSGEERWTYRLNDLLDRSSPAAIGAWAVFGDASGLAAAIDIGSGRLVWEDRVGPGPVGAPASDGERLYLTSRAADGQSGATVALANDPGGVPLDEPSPTALFLLSALGNYALAFVLAGAGIFLMFRYLVPERREGVDPSDGEGS